MTFRIYHIIFLPLVFCLLTFEKARGQNRTSDTTIVITDTTNLDALFKKARDYCNDNNYAQARRICLKILEKKPNYYDVRTFLGRIYSWEKQYDNARTELSRVLIEKDDDYEALNALFDVEFWTESYSVANDYLKIALGYYPTSEELLLKKAKLEIRLEDKAEAALTLRRVLELNHGQKEAISLMNTLAGRKLNNTFQSTFIVDLYDKRDPMQMVSAEFGHIFSFASFIARCNAADRYGSRGLQFEIESYAHITKSNYINLLAGYSEIFFFPKTSFLAEFYQKLPKGFEFSIGLNLLQYTTRSNIITASFSKYYKDYYFSVRTYLNPKTDSIVNHVQLDKTAFTLIGNIRTYFGDSENYFGIKAGKGLTPEENKALDVAPFLPTYQAGFELQKRAFGRWLIEIDMTYAKENSSVSNYFQRISTLLSLKTVF